MLTDWVLIRRLARELDERLRGARVEDAGLLADGRIGLLFRLRGARPLLAIELFGSPPLITLETGELGISPEPGFVRALARSLQGMALASVSARRNDRLLRFSFAARSRFGVGDELDLYVELVPRFGNLVLVKNERVVAARKEFAPSENGRRRVVAGEPYALPPLPARARTISPTEPATDDAALDSPLYAYRRDGTLVQAYVAPLEGFDDATKTREASLLALFTELRMQEIVRMGERRNDQRRRTLLKRLDERERKLRDEVATLKEKRAHAERRDGLRAEGEEIFATLHELGESEREAKKERAGKLFSEYKKLGKSLPHVAVRARALAAALVAVDALRWEAERAADEDLGDVATAVDELLPQRKAQAPRSPVKRRKRALLELRTPHGSRIVIGRSPLENAELTFRLARPDDLWFHARGIPGAHVILARENRVAAPEDDVLTAASLAAFYSKARAANSVPVDYTLRKHVRKQRAAPPGLVWYTHADTIVAQPKSLDSFG
jgi:predicted ribosome quality control (RQC) complex YloA/Tae2 family protein